MKPLTQKILEQIKKGTLRSWSELASNYELPEDFILFNPDTESSLILTQKLKELKAIEKKVNDKKAIVIKSVGKKEKNDKM